LTLTFPASNQSTENSIVSYIFVWIVLPIFAGVAIAGYSLRYCLHRFRAFTQPANELMEEEISSTPAIQEKEGSDAHVD
jgi:hypothetical protein